MTTLAYDGITLATDSQVVSGGLRFGKMNKIIKLNDGRRFAIAGDPSVIPAIADWLNGFGDKPELDKTEKVRGILVSPDGTATEISNNLRLWSACVPWTAGSGEDFAMTAMHCGKTAKEAVELACKLDTTSGLPVNVFRPKGRG